MAGCAALSITVSRVSGWVYNRYSSRFPLVIYPRTENSKPKEPCAQARYPQRRHHRPRRSRENDPGRRDDASVQALPQHRPDGRLHPRFGRSRARTGHHHRRQEHVARLAGRQDQHRRYARPLGLRRRSGARAPDGRRRPAPHRRGGRPAAADPLRAQESPGAGPPAHRRHQQDRPPGRPDPGGPRRDRRPLHRARRRRRAVEFPGHLRFGPERHVDGGPGRARRET